MTRSRPGDPTREQQLEAETSPRASTPAHEHAWRTESRHPTSEGWVLYVRCACGVRRVDQQQHVETPPAALTAAIAAPSLR